MIYDKERVIRIIEHKDNVLDTQIKEDIEWIIGCYNDYYANWREYEQQRKNYKKVMNKYYNSEDEKASLKEMIIELKRKNKALQMLYDLSCKNGKTVI